MREKCARVLAAALMTGAIGFALAMPAFLGTGRDAERSLTAPPSFLQRSVHVVASAPSRSGSTGRLDNSNPILAAVFVPAGRSGSTANGGSAAGTRHSDRTGGVKKPRPAPKPPATPPSPTPTPTPTPTPPTTPAADTRGLATTTTPAAVVAAPAPSRPTGDNGNGNGKGKGHDKNKDKEKEKGKGVEPTHAAAPVATAQPANESPPAEGEKNHGGNKDKDKDKRKSDDKGRNG